MREPFLTHQGRDTGRPRITLQARRDVAIGIRVVVQPPPDGTAHRAQVRKVRRANERLRRPLAATSQAKRFIAIANRLLAGLQMMSPTRRIAS